jgi:hypothetical protein
VIKSDVLNEIHAQIGALLEARLPALDQAQSNVMFQLRGEKHPGFSATLIRDPQTGVLHVDFGRSIAPETESHNLTYTVRNIREQLASRVLVHADRHPAVRIDRNELIEELAADLRSLDIQWNKKNLKFHRLQLGNAVMQVVSLTVYCVNSEQPAINIWREGFEKRFNITLHIKTLYPWSELPVPPPGSSIARLEYSMNRPHVTVSPNPRAKGYLPYDNHLDRATFSIDPQGTKREEDIIFTHPMRESYYVAAYTPLFRYHPNGFRAQTLSLAVDMFVDACGNLTPSSVALAVVENKTRFKLSQIHTALLDTTLPAPVHSALCATRDAVFRIRSQRTENARITEEVRDGVGGVIVQEITHAAGNVFLRHLTSNGVPVIYRVPLPLDRQIFEELQTVLPKDFVLHEHALLQSEMLGSILLFLREHRQRNLLERVLHGVFTAPIYKTGIPREESPASYYAPFKGAGKVGQINQSQALALITRDLPNAQRIKPYSLAELDAMCEKKNSALRYRVDISARGIEDKTVRRLWKLRRAGEEPTLPGRVRNITPHGLIVDARFQNDRITGFVPRGFVAKDRWNQLTKDGQVQVIWESFNLFEGWSSFRVA